MVKYIFELKIEGDHEVYQCILDLNLDQENHPEFVFDTNLKQIIKANLESQSDCKINSVQINYMLSTWAQDIAQGYRTTQISLDLAYVIQDKLSRLQDQGLQDPPKMSDPPLDQIEPTMLPPLTLIPD
jgi:hypothetical protein